MLPNEVSREVSLALLGLGIELGAFFFGGVLGALTGVLNALDWALVIELGAFFLGGVLVAITGVLNALDRALVTLTGPSPRLLPSDLEM